MPRSCAIYQFGPFHLDTCEHRLLRDGVEVPLQLKAFETLCLLVERAGQPSRVLALQRIAALARTTQRAGFTTGRGEQQNEWAGPLLWDVLGASGLIEGANPREQAHLAVRVTGADGYSAVIAFGEISPQFADRPILLADQRNGAPLPEHALRLIVPGDRLVAEVERIGKLEMQVGEVLD